MSASADLKVSDIEFNFLPYIYEIIRGIEKECSDVGKSSQELVQKVGELQAVLEKTRAQVVSLPGVEFSRPEQLRRLHVLKQQLQLKQQLLARYEHLTSLPAPASAATVTHASQQHSAAVVVDSAADPSHH